MPLAVTESPLVADQGADWPVTVTWKPNGTTPKDVTGFTAELRFEQLPSPNVSPTNITGPSAQLAVGTTDGTFTIHVPGSVTAGWKFATQRFQLFVTAPVGQGGEVDVLLAGELSLNRRL